MTTNVIWVQYCTRVESADLVPGIWTGPRCKVKAGTVQEYMCCQNRQLQYTGHERLQCQGMYSAKQADCREGNRSAHQHKVRIGVVQQTGAYLPVVRPQVHSSEVNRVWCMVGCEVLASHSTPSAAIQTTHVICVCCSTEPSMSKLALECNCLYYSYRCTDLEPL